jgi:hypothetical protein
MRIRGFSDVQEAGSATQQVVADLGLTPLTVVGFSAAAGKVSCFVEIPWTGFKSDPTAAFRTELRFRGYAEVMLSVVELLNGGGPFGFVAVERPFFVLGEEYQPATEEPIIAAIPELIVAVGPSLIGPPRCFRCNHAVPMARARLVGPTGLCVRCQSETERRVR